VRRDDERLADILWDVAVIDVPQLASQVLAIQSGGLPTRACAAG
jgi:hypothetical protein